MLTRKFIFASTGFIVTLIAALVLRSSVLKEGFAMNRLALTAIQLIEIIRKIYPSNPLYQDFTPAREISPIDINGSLCIQPKCVVIYGN